MCNRFKQLEVWPNAREMKIPIAWPERVLRNSPDPDIRPTDQAQVLLWDEDHAAATDMRWGFPPPPGRKGGPVINYRSEGRKYGSRRCLVPAELFYEFTGTGYPKTKWTVRLADGAWMCMAGVWREAQGDLPATFSILTTEPGADILPIHDREMVTIDREHWQRWLAAEDDAQDLFRPRPAGTFRVAREAADVAAKRRQAPKPPQGSLL